MANLRFATAAVLFFGLSQARGLGFCKRLFLVLFEGQLAEVSGFLGVCPYALGARRRLWFGHGCKGNRMLLEHKRDYGLGMDAKGTVCCWNTKEMMVRAWVQR